MRSNFKAMVLSCIDPRFQALVYNYLKKKKLIGKYSAFTIAGGAVGVTHNKFKKWHSVFIENLSTSIKLHKIEKLIIINHIDCGAAKIANGEKKFNFSIENKIHKTSIIKLKKIVKIKFPEVKVESYMMLLNGKIRKLK